MSASGTSTACTPAGAMRMAQEPETDVVVVKSAYVGFLTDRTWELFMVVDFSRALQPQCWPYKLKIVEKRVEHSWNR